MAYQDRLKISIQDEAGLYYTATLNNDNTYTVTTGATLDYIKHLPIGWQDTSLKWERNMTYMGVFRAQANNMDFVKDARAILLSRMYGGGGVNAYALIKVYKLRQSPTIGYDLFFEAEADFSACSDNKQKGIFTVPLLQSRANELLKAKSTSNFNIPFWVYNEDDEEWEPNGDIFNLRHDGIKLLYRSTWVSQATPTLLLHIDDLGHWNNGEHGTGVNRGVHMLPPMYLYNIVQNNGTTTYIGNDIMQPLIPTSNQAGYIISDGEVNFNDVSKPFTTNNNLIKIVGLDSLSISASIKGKVEGVIGYDVISGTPDFNLKFVLFEILPTNEPPQTTPGEYDIFATLFEYHITGFPPFTPPSSGEFDTASTPVNVTLTPNKVYTLGIIFQNNPGGNTGLVDFYLSNLEVTFFSDYNSGTAAPVSAPTFPASDIICMRPINVWEKLIQSIDSVSTNSFGMPEIVGNFTGVSDYLSSVTNPDDNYDISPNRTAYTSENAVRNIKGIPYITISVADFFTQQFRIEGCGMAIEGDNFRIEKLEYFFDAATEILDLGTNISGFTISPMSQEMFNNIKCGYKQPATNNNFGVDEFNTPAEYYSPSNKTPKQEDLSISSAVVGMYEIEKMRAQVNASDVSSPSAGNSTVILLTTDVDPVEEVEVLDPAGGAHMVPNETLTRYPNAQSTDPTAATDPYINGLYYPDTAANVGLLPQHNMYRLGRLIASYTDQLDTEVLAYRKQYQQNYANPLSPLTNPGVSINITGATLVSSTGDIPISSLGNKLFRPYLFKFQASYTEAMYTLINANPNGYISAEWKGDIYKGFIYSVEQIVGDNSPVTFTLIAHPGTTDEQLRKD